MFAAFTFENFADDGHYAASHLTEAEIERALALHESALYSGFDEFDVPLRDMVHYRLRDEASAKMAAEAIRSFFTWEDEEQ